MKRFQVLGLVVFIFVTQSAFSQIPKTITYQGVLTDANNVSLPDANYAMNFRLYEAATGGQAIWTESRTVELSDGVFSVVLGENNVLNLPFDKPYWLGVSVNGESELTPRLAVTSSAYSLTAHEVRDGAITDAKIAAGQVVKSINGIKDDVQITAGDNISILKNNNSLIISADTTGGGGSSSGWQISNNNLIATVSGNVGIGTTSPGDLLQIGSAIALHDGGNKVIGLGWSPGTGNSLIDGYPADIRIDPNVGGIFFRTESVKRQPGEAVGSVDRLVIDRNGRVGIGTSTPGATLDVLGDGTTDFRVGQNEGINLHLKNFRSQLSDVPGSTFGMQMIGPSSSHIVMDLQGNDGSDGFYVRIPSDLANPSIVDRTAFTVHSSGRIGIGTSTPGATLDVRSDGITDFRVGQKEGIDLHLKNFNTQLSDIPGSIFGMQIIGPSSSHIVMDLQGNDGSDGFYVRVPSDFQNPDIVDHTVFTVQSNGRVGIGTTAPLSKFHLTASGTGWDDHLILEGSDLTKKAQWNVLVDSGLDNILRFRNRETGIEPLTLTPDGIARTRVLEITGGADLAEPFEMSDENLITAGSVVVIDPDNPGQLTLSNKAYDTCVAGIVSGAGGVNPGLTLQQEGVLENGQNVALSGRVYAKATAANGAIRPGDLLTTSDIPGHAMKATDRSLAHGTVIGKAMTALEAGEGLVLVLVNLQ